MSTRDERGIVDRDRLAAFGGDQPVAPRGVAHEQRGEGADHRRAGDGRPSWSQLPSARMRIRLSVVSTGFHCSTGGSLRSATALAMSSSDIVRKSGGAS
jgi:hypothetical protein